jgi:hypothetical protein
VAVPLHVPWCCDTDDGDHDELSHLFAVSLAARGVSAGLFDLAPVITATTTPYRAGLPSATAIQWQIAASFCPPSSLIRQVKGAKVKGQC